MPDDRSESVSSGLSSVLSGGNRRIDRVLSEGYLDGITALPLAEVRDLRNEAEQEEADLSYVRRLLQGRVDIIRAELARRRGELGESGSIIDQLPNILADDRAPARGLGRHTVIEPSRVDEHRRLVERLVADSDLSALAGRTADQLEETLVRFGEHEKEISEQRRKVQAVMDACAAEITRRYREGEADVSALLPSEN
ncbi:MAG TPA: aerial mycelium formation protein [Acidothermaceae bacterium]